jgi:hypothetical protein
MNDELAFQGHSQGLCFVLGGGLRRPADSGLGPQRETNNWIFRHTFYPMSRALMPPDGSNWRGGGGDASVPEAMGRAVVALVGLSTRKGWCEAGRSGTWSVSNPGADHSMLSHTVSCVYIRYIQLCMVAHRISFCTREHSVLLSHGHYALILPPGCHVLSNFPHNLAQAALVRGVLRFVMPNKGTRLGASS